MGIEIKCANLFLRLKDAGAPMESVISVGRQQFALIDEEITALERDLPESLDELKGLSLDDKFADPFFHALGASTVHSIDVSDYESCTHVHDLNGPIPEEWRGQYDIVFDGGSLEHVFNLPTALKNCMQMVRPGGHFITFSPANNFMGHGFYQFSPELFFRALSPNNGFEILQALLLEMTPKGRIFAVTDPSQAGARTGLESAHPLILAVIARRCADVPIFETPPQQSDYSVRWQAHVADTPPSPVPAPGRQARRLSRWLPEFVARPIRWALNRRKQRLRGLKGLREIRNLRDVEL